MSGGSSTLLYLHRYHNRTLYYTNSNIPYMSHIAIPSTAIITRLSLRRRTKSIVYDVVDTYIDAVAPQLQAEPPPRAWNLYQSL